MRAKTGNRLWLRAVPFGLLAFVALSSLSVLAEAADEEAVARGKISYRVYCSNCHGRDARGDGELAELLTVPPADLAAITEKYEGKFPAEWLHRIIDGRERVRGHGMQEMPVWGLTFRDRDLPADQEEEVARKIAELLAYLESIQH